MPQISAVSKAISKETSIQSETLDTLAEGRDYAQRTLKLFQPFLKGRILEIGAGIGTMTGILLEKGHEVMATDLETERLKTLSQRLSPFSKQLDVAQCDLNKIHEPELQQQWKSSFDTIVAVNVIEHIEDDTKCLIGLKQLLRPGGNLCVLVPAHSFLYSQFDRSIGHFRRYNKSGLNKLLLQAGFQVKMNRYFNAVAILGWILNFKVLNKSQIPHGQFRLFEALNPVLSLEDYITKLPCGLSVVAVGQNG